MRTSYTFSPQDIEVFKHKLFHWSAQFNDIVWLNSNQDLNADYDAVLAVDAFTAIQTDYTEALDALDEYQHQTQDWIFGYLGYDIKNGIENLKSKNDDNLRFPDLYFFQPQKLFLIKGKNVECLYLNMVAEEIKDDLKTIGDQYLSSVDNTFHQIDLKSKISKQTYLSKVKEVIKHIQRGDIYEMNFCQEFYAEKHDLNPHQCFQDLNDISRPPFACFFKHEHLYALGASPERFLKKSGKKIISQPIKGTARRHSDTEVDKNYKLKLQQDPKEIAENVMIVDLVRNDLSKIAVKNSVEVEELCKIYSYKQVHQMISTISAELKTETNLKEILKATFPMGSMTGAPKVSAMQIIEELESTKRGLYSGCIGYITPDFDFDFNVVIRSILHNVLKQYTSLMVGSAITHKSIPENEYEECLVKAKALMEVLKNEQVSKEFFHAKTPKR
ncbi:anthranilate synthase component I family protein [Mesohalobacter halotolerans]|uniref:Anthranilate synthase component I family protein n=1 Tax=Mesohalobacter halotolerans TaxID=1883405 RepID=A0A4U5TR50_9FLAO|nr:anthranilate synthase component I family protein [Mesohalobacter halotolerans]TKS56707.1 anthranilate synthase component I family protein [Mesohalobacter halotolerans]